MNARANICLLLLVGLLLGAQAKCGAQLESSVEIDIASPKVIKTLWVNSVYTYTTKLGDSFAVQFTGTDNGTASWVIGDSPVYAEVTLSIASDGVVIGTPSSTASPSSATPSKPTISASNSLTVSIARLVVAVCGIFVLRHSTKGSAIALIIVLCLSYMNVIDSKLDPPCEGGSVEIQIPSGKVQKICNVDTGDCACGPDYTGPNCNYYKSKCIPTSQQLANRFSNVTLNPEDIPLPEPGQSYCDSNFGTEIWRVSNRQNYTDPDQVYATQDYNLVIDQRIHIIGLMGFSPGLKYALSSTARGAFGYEVNVDEYNVPHIDPTKRILLQYGYNEANAGVYFDASKGGWMNDTHYFFLNAHKIYAFDIEAPLIRGGPKLTEIGDVAPFLTNSYYPNPLYDIQRCTLARRKPDGSVRMQCDIGYGVSELNQPPDTSRIDSHSPNATCINAQYFNGASARIGYFVIDVLSAAPADPSTNVKLYARFINGVDSDAWYCFQSGRQWSSALNDYRTWIPYNGQNNGYKLNMDRTGEWFNSAGAIDLVETLGHSVGIQPAYKVRMDPWSVGGGIVKGFVQDWEGHNAHGWAESIMQAGAPDPCGWCMAYLNWTNFGDDDPGKVWFTNVIAPNYEGNPPHPWIYDHGLYSTYAHATPRTKGEAIMQTGLDCSKWDCTIAPRANEVLRVTPTPDGGGTVERIASTRETLHTLYAVVTSECEDENGACWALFQSSWGADHSIAPNGNVPTDIFMVRFR